MAKRQRKPSKKPIKVAKAFEYKEKVLNYTAQTYQLTRPKKVGPMMELIRQCQPKTFDDWPESPWQSGSCHEGSLHSFFRFIAAAIMNKADTAQN